MLKEYYRFLRNAGLFKERELEGSCNLELHGFKTGYVCLPGLDINLKLNPDEYFRNDHFVDNIHEHQDKISREFNAVLPKISGYPPLGGITMKLHEKDKKGASIKGALIFLLDIEYYTNLFLYGHEATHALINLGHKDELIKELKKEGFSLDPFKKYDNEEDIADVGGLLGIYKRRTLFKEFNNLKKKQFMNKNNISFLLEDLIKSRDN